MLNTRGGEAFAESMDRSRINFLVALLSKSAPKQKKILVDLRDERIFKELWSLKAKNIVAVVNQWHMEGVETHWRRITGT
jgi:pheromone shutdown protein TraB